MISVDKGIELLGIVGKLIASAGNSEKQQELLDELLDEIQEEVREIDGLDSWIEKLKARVDREVGGG